MMSVASPFLEQQMHPTVIISAFRQALEDLLEILKDVVSVPVDINDHNEMKRIIKSCIGTKLVTKWLV
jgi:T-complex protein 1 subunit gamma